MLYEQTHIITLGDHMGLLLDLLIPGRTDESHDFRLRSQLPFLALASLILFVLYLAILPMTYLSNGIDIFFWVMFPILAAQTASLVLLRKGSFRVAAYLSTISLVGASYAALFLMAYQGNNVLEAYRGL